MSAADTSITIDGTPLPEKKKSESPNPEGLRKLFADFRIDDKVVTHLLDVTKIESFRDFNYLVASEAEWSAIVAKAGLAEGPAQLQTARVRQAWSAVRTTIAAGDAVKDKSMESADLDLELPAKDLATVRAAFWQRYHIRHPVFIDPSDAQLSRIIREVHHRLLSVRPVASVQSQLSKIQSVSRSSQPDLAGLFMYLSKLRTLCLTYSMAGCKPLPDAPGAETATTDPIEFVEVPYETAMSYFWKAERAAMAVAALKGETFAMHWLQSRDEGDRTAWVDLSRTSSLSLGNIMDRISKVRESMWLYDDLVTKAPLQQPRQPATEAQNRRADKHLLLKDQFDWLNNGKRICRAFNSRDGCTDPCPFGQEHVCNKLVRPNGACGLRNHTYLNCQASKGGRGSKRRQQKGQ